MAVKKISKTILCLFLPSLKYIFENVAAENCEIFFWTYTHITSREKLENKGRGRTEIVNVVSGVYVLRRISFFSWKVESSRTEVLFIQHLKFFSLSFRYYLPSIYLSNTIFQAVKRGQIVTFVHTLVQISVWQKKVC